MTHSYKLQLKASKTTDLNAYVSANQGEFKIAAHNRGRDNEMLDNAIEIVRKFIISNKLILFGGLAIDYALRLKGESIYPDNQFPDFDVLSPNSVEDAYSLAAILYRLQFDDIGAIRGMHVQTMRVRSDYNYLCDVGYVPQAVYDRIPTINYNGIQVVHPNYQRMDMHLAFSFPFANAPREDIHHRWKKDHERLALYNKHYPIEHKHIITKLTKIVGDIPAAAYALHGFAAYALLRKEVGSRVSESVAPLLPITIVGNKITLEAPADNIAIVTYDEFEPMFEPYMDLMPRSAVIDNVTIYLTAGKLLAIRTIGEHKVVCFHYLLLWFLYKAHTSENAQLYFNYYLHTMALMSSATELSVDTFGVANVSESHIIRFANINQIPIPTLPENYFPERGIIPNKFEYEKNILFRRSGAAIK